MAGLPAGHRQTVRQVRDTAAVLVVKIAALLLDADTRRVVPSGWRPCCFVGGQCDAMRCDALYV